MVRCLVEGFEGFQIQTVALDSPDGLARGNAVYGTGRPISLSAGPHLKGGLLDGMGGPADGSVPIQSESLYPTMLPRGQRLTLFPFKRKFQSGLRCIDTLMPLAAGQRVSLQSNTTSPGLTAKTLSMMARYSSAGVVVFGLIGTSRRRVAELLASLEPQARAKSAIFAAPSDRGAGERYHCVYAATAAAEYFRDLGEDVLLIVDCLKAWQESYLELSLQIPQPTRISLEGVPLSRLVERAGPRPRGSITAIYSIRGAATTLTRSLEELADGRICLSGEMEGIGIYPPIDVLNSHSRPSQQFLSPRQLRMVSSFQWVMRYYQRNRQLIQVGALFKGLSERSDQALDKVERCWSFLRQGINEPSCEEEDLRRLAQCVG
jgi:flagellar biosynthesis/type III secretory pathway ATPase